MASRADLHREGSSRTHARLPEIAVGTIARPSLDLGNDGDVDGGLPPLLPPGIYTLRLTYWTTYLLYGRLPKLAIWFQVMDQGSHFETEVPRHYNITRMVGHAGRSGRFKAPATGDLARDYARLLALPARFDRFNLEQLKRHLIVGKVETVTGQQARQLAPAVHYSIVRELVR